MPVQLTLNLAAALSDGRVDKSEATALAHEGRRAERSDQQRLIAALRTTPDKFDADATAILKTFARLEGLSTQPETRQIATVFRMALSDGLLGTEEMTDLLAYAAATPEAAQFFTDQALDHMPQADAGARNQANAFMLSRDVKMTATPVLPGVEVDPTQKIAEAYTRAIADGTITLAETEGLIALASEGGITPTARNALRYGWLENMGKAGPGADQRMLAFLSSSLPGPVPPGPVPPVPPGPVPPVPPGPVPPVPPGPVVGQLVTPLATWRGEPGTHVEFKAFERQKERKPSGWGSVVVDIVEHLPRQYGNQYDGDSLTTTAHETTHGVNSHIRNGNTQPGKKVNGFYVLQNRAVVIEEPRARKSDAASLVPTSLRNHLYKLYVTGQREWDDTPLYLMDEWTAYTNGTACALDQLKNNAYRGNIEGELAFAIQFNAFVLSLAQAIHRKDPEYFKRNEQFREYLAFNLKRVMDLYQECVKYPVFQFSELTSTMNTFVKGQDAEEMRKFARDLFGAEWANRVLFNEKYLEALQTRR